jgi:hypothetical protein
MLAMTIFAPPARAETTALSDSLNLESISGRGTVYGKVTDRSTGEPLVGANVILISTQLGAATNLDGEFVINNIPPGIYPVRASVLGYANKVRTDVSVTPSRPVRLDFELEQTAVQLEAVEVRAKLFQKESDAKVSTVRVTNEEIRRLPGGFEDVVRAVSILPGVAQPMPGRNDLIVRGGAPSENLYILDNIEIPNINHFGTQGATGGPQSMVNLDYVDRTDFSAGGFGARYGDKLSSVLRIDLRNGREDRIGGKATVSASQFGFNLEGPLPDGEGSFLFSARRSYLDLIFKAAGFAFVPEYWDFLAKASYAVTPKDRISFTGIGALDKVLLFNDDQDQRYNNSRIPASSQNTAVFGATWKHLFGNGFTTFTLSQNYQDFDTVQRDSLLNDVFRSNSIEQGWTARGDLIYKPWEQTELTLGVQQTLARYESTQFIRFQTSFGDSLTRNDSYKTMAGKTAVYGQVSQTIDRLRLTGGLRLDAFDLIEDGLGVGPRVSATYALTSLTNLNLSLGRYYQSPSAVWILSNPANDDLSMIGVDQIVAGFDHLLRYDVRLTVEGYYKEYFDYPTSLERPWLVMANTGAGFGGSQSNFSSYGFDRLAPIGTGWARGFEIFGQKKAGENPHYAIVSLSYNEAWFSGLDGVERPGAYDQRWIFNLGGGFIWSNNLETSVRFRLATGMPYTPYEEDGSQDPAKYNSERTDLNHSLDIRVDRRWFFDSWTLIGYIDIQNVYNRQFNDIPRWDVREQRPVQDEGIGILPSIGISLEF